MRVILTIAAITIALSLHIACHAGSATNALRNEGRLTEDERHRLYAAALAASNAPLDSELFKNVCEKIGIFDGTGNPNDQYVDFVTVHVNWTMKQDDERFRREIETPESAREYISRYLPR